MKSSQRDAPLCRTTVKPPPAIGWALVVMLGVAPVYSVPTCRLRTSRLPSARLPSARIITS